MLISDCLTEKSYPLPKNITNLLRSGAELLWDDIMESLIHLYNGGKPEDTNFFDDLPPIGRPILNVRLRTNFLRALDMLTFKMFGTIPMAFGCTAEELLFHWIIRNAKVCADDDGNDSMEKELDDYWEAALEDSDYLYLFDPKYDGIDTIKELHIQSLNPKDWFSPFHSLRLAFRTIF